MFNVLQVVITNQVTCKLDEDKTVAALGKMWSHTASSKLFLERCGAFRRATLTKSIIKRPCEVYYQITVFIDLNLFVFISFL